MRKIIAIDYFKITPLNYQAKCGGKLAKFLPHLIISHVLIHLK
ncbi:hypothetical protein ACLSZP_05530 [Avibacterium avium]